MEKQSLRFPKTIAVIDDNAQKKFAASASLYAKLIILGGLSFVGLMVIGFYNNCKTACSSLRGDIFGIELQYIGIVYMATIIVLVILKKDKYLLTLLSAGVGSEIYLIGFQIWHHTYCPYCIAFGAVVVVQFIVSIVLNITLKKTFKTILLVLLPMMIAFVLFFAFFEGTIAIFQYTF